MSATEPTVTVHVNIDLAASSIQTVVANAKKKAGPDEKGRFRVDPADVLSGLITRFLSEKGFDEFVSDEGNY